MIKCVMKEFKKHMEEKYGSVELLDNHEVMACINIIQDTLIPELVRRQIPPSVATAAILIHIISQLRMNGHDNIDDFWEASKEASKYFEFECIERHRIDANPGV